VLWQLVPKFRKIVKFFQGFLHQWRGGHRRLRTANKIGTLKLKVKVLVRFFDTIQYQCQISCVVVVFVVAFLPFHFCLLHISINQGPE
jgi:hypothetical protein